MNDAAMHVLRVTDLSGVLANALLGGVLARARGFDLVGFAVLAVGAARTAGGAQVSPMWLVVVYVAARYRS